MKTTIARIFLVALLAAAMPRLASGADKPGGTGAVATWPSLAMDRAKAIGLPVCLYVYNGGAKKSTEESTFLEGKDFLDDPDVKAALKGFTCMKIDVKSSKTIPKNWTPDLVQKFKAQKNAVVLMDSSLIHMVIYKHKGYNALPAEPKSFIATVEKLKKIEEGRKATAKKEDKEKGKEEEKVVDARPKTVGGIPGLADPNAKEQAKDGNEKKAPTQPAKPEGPVDE